MIIIPVVIWEEEAETHYVCTERHSRRAESIWTKSKQNQGKEQQENSSVLIVALFPNINATSYQWIQKNTHCDQSISEYLQKACNEADTEGPGDMKMKRHTSCFQGS